VTSPRIHARVTGAFALLILLTGVQIALVAYLQRTTLPVEDRLPRLLLTLLPAAELAIIIILLLTTRRAVFLPRATLASSARVHAETAAINRELLAIINTGPAALVIMNRDGSIRLQNNAAEYLLGKAPETEAERTAYWQRFGVRDAAGRSLPVRDLAPVRALAGAEIIGEEMEVRRADGRAAIILASAAPLRDEAGEINGVAAGFQDITRLRELDRMKDEFVSVVSHELRTPLTAIRGSLQLLVADERSIPDDDDRQLLQVALKSCERLVRIINDILDISKMEAGKLRLDLTAVSVGDVVDTSIADVQPIATAAGVRLQAMVPPSLPPILADADRLTQALVNLVSNAVKFAPPGTDVTVAAREDVGVIVLTVEDRGEGIPEQDIPRLFQKFHQLDGSVTRRVGGTGLGLAITKAIVEEHGGTVSVRSTLGSGTTFELRIPRISPVAMTSGAAAPARRIPRRPKRVLIVDDDRDTRQILRMSLEMDGFEVMEAATGREGVRQAKEHLPDAITLDMIMPDGDGRWVLSELQGNPLTAAIPVIVVSGAGPDETVTSGPILHKPFDPTDLVSTVRGVLSGRTSGRVLVVDDDEDVRHVLRETLQRLGCEVVEAADGRDALERAGREDFDLVLMDLHVPHVHGHDIIRALRDPALKRRVPIIVLSGSVGEQQTMQSLVLGANVFLSKPPDSAALAEQVERLLRRPE
jgi:PAS domain S-box-containing protein